MGCLSCGKRLKKLRPISPNQGYTPAKVKTPTPLVPPASAVAVGTVLPTKEPDVEPVTGLAKDVFKNKNKDEK